MTRLTEVHAHIGPKFIITSEFLFHTKQSFEAAKKIWLVISMRLGFKETRKATRNIFGAGYEYFYPLMHCYAMAGPARILLILLRSS
jgi:hypothetical protein